MPDAHFFKNDWGVYPVLFRWGFVQIESYTAMIFLGLFFALMLYRLTVSKSSQSQTRETWLIPVLGLCFGTLGAKLPILMTASTVDWNGAQAALAMTSGKTIVGGMLGGWIGVVSAKQFLGIRERRGNQFAPALALGLAFGRMGCLLQGCCYGIPTQLSWGVDFGDGIHRHPTQGYEIGFHLTVCLLMLATGSFRKSGGLALKMYFIAYLIFRFGIEFIRVEPRAGLGLTGYQWAALVFVPVLFGAAYREKKIQQSNNV